MTATPINLNPVIGNSGHISNSKEIARRVKVAIDLVGGGIQGLLDDVAAEGGGTARLSEGIYSFTQLVIPPNVSIIGEGAGITVLQPTGAGPNITTALPLSHQRFSGFSLNHSNNANANVDFIKIPYGMTGCNWDDIYLIGKNGVTRDGITILGQNPDTLANNSTYYNTFTNLQMWANVDIAGTALNLSGVPEVIGVGANQFIGGFITKWTKLIHICGANNTFIGTNFYATDVGIHMEDIRISNNNTFVNCWWDGDWTGKIKIQIDNDHTPVYTDSSGKPIGGFPVVTFLSGLQVPEALADLTLGGTHPELIVAKFYV